MDKSQKTRLFDLTIVLSVAILPAIVRSTYVFIHGPGSIDVGQLNFGFLNGSLVHCLSIFLLFYVLWNRNKSWRDLGIEINYKEILYGIGLSIVASGVFAIAGYILRGILPDSHTKDMAAKNVGFLYDHFSWALLIYILINPFFEELIVRGYVMTEIFSWSKSKTLTIAVSVFIQSSYHLYQCILPTLILACGFWVYSYFYFRTGKLTPVIIAHLIADLLILTRLR